MATSPIDILIQAVKDANAHYDELEVMYDHFLLDGPERILCKQKMGQALTGIKAARIELSRFTKGVSERVPSYML